MPDTDALNLALHRYIARNRLGPNVTMEDATLDSFYVGGVEGDYCTDLNAAVDAIQALGLDWAYYPVYRSVHVMERQWEGTRRRVETATAANTTPAALATALVRAALRVLA